jgi:hypothetical protein
MSSRSRIASACRSGRGGRGIVVVAVFGTGIERFIYRPLAVRAGDTALLAIFVASSASRSR